MGFPPRTGDNAALPAPRAHKRRHLSYERRLQLFTALMALVGLAAAAAFLWTRDWSLLSRLAALFALLLIYWLLGIELHQHVARPLQTLANVVAALREEDFSFRLRDAAVDDAFGGLSLEVNELADLLSAQRSRAVEATVLLQRVVAEIEAPLFAFDPGHVLELVNPAGERLLQRTSSELLGHTAEQNGLSALLSAPNETVIGLPPGSTSPQWLLHRSSFRQEGVPHTLLILSDISRVLREQERLAWQRLVRVLGHELNNSLAPIKSIAGSLNARIPETTLTPDERQDFSRGLEIIETRAGSLNRFLQAYRQLAQMPAPVLRPTPIAPLIHRVAGLETRLPVTVIPGPELTLSIDPDQIEQMLINLVRNGVEAALDSQGDPRTAQKSDAPQVQIGWQLAGNNVALTVEDNGPGIANPANAFVPFYTTKPAGTGIGLALCRQIAEALHGAIELSNRPGGKGCRVTISLPYLRPPG